MDSNYKIVFKTFSSILWGLGLAAIFSQICKTKNCVIVKGIHPDKIKDKVFKKPEDHFKNETTQCYKLIEEETPCNENPILV